MRFSKKDGLASNTMRLDQALVARALCESRTEAQELIKKGNITVNGEVCTKQIRNILDEDRIEASARRKYVSRGGEKLEGAFMDMYGNEEGVISVIRNSTALDIGSSTGGFTDFLLKHGASRVDAVDVGTAQLHASLRGKSNVLLFENTNIRQFVSDRKYEIIVADLSFVPLEHVFMDIIRFSKKGTLFVLLIKPQFEVGKGHIKKGVVKDAEKITAALIKYERMAQEQHLKGIHIIPSHIRGGDGNQEFFLIASV